MGAWGTRGDSGLGDSPHSNPSPAGTPPTEAGAAAETPGLGHAAQGAPGDRRGRTLPTPGTPESSPTPRAGVRPCRSDAAPAPAAVPPALRLRCQPGARLLFPQHPQLWLLMTFSCRAGAARAGGCRGPPSRDTRAATARVLKLTPETEPGRLSGGGNKWVRVLGGPGRGLGVRAAVWLSVGARRHLPGSAAGSGIYTSRSPPLPPRRAQVPLGGALGAVPQAQRVPASPRPEDSQTPPH